jgi:hypothetical protein
MSTDPKEPIQIPTAGQAPWIIFGVVTFWGFIAWQGNEFHDVASCKGLAVCLVGLICLCLTRISSQLSALLKK